MNKVNKNPTTKAWFYAPAVGQDVDILKQTNQQQNATTATNSQTPGCAPLTQGSASPSQNDPARNPAWNVTQSSWAVRAELEFAWHSLKALAQVVCVEALSIDRCSSGKPWVHSALSCFFVVKEGGLGLKWSSTPLGQVPSPTLSRLISITTPWSEDHCSHFAGTKWGNSFPKKQSNLRRVTQYVLGRAWNKTPISQQLHSRNLPH